jgi:hypothetical protein
MPAKYDYERGSDDDYQRRSRIIHLGLAIPHHLPTPNPKALPMVGNLYRLLQLQR